MKRLNVAIIGQGRSGRDIHGHFFKSENNKAFDVVAVVERDARRRNRALESPRRQAMQSAIMRQSRQM